MCRFNKILCPVDFDSSSLTALRLAAELSREQSGTLYVLHVVDVAIPPKTHTTATSDRLEAAAAAKLERLIRRNIERRVRHKIYVENGDPAAEILGATKRLRANLIVMATHGRKGLRRLVLGSVAARVVREASCPVLTVTPTASRVCAPRTKASQKT